MLLNVSAFLYVMSLAHTYMRLFVYVLLGLFTYLHIFPLSVSGKELDDGGECEKRRVGEGGGN